MLKWLNKKRNKKGFTLVELVVVIAILGIIAAIAVPRLTGFRNTAQVAADEASKETIIKAAELYMATYDVSDPETSLSGKIGELPPALYDMIDLDDLDKFTLNYNTTTGEFTVTTP